MGLIPDKKTFKIENGLCIMQDGKTTNEEISIFDYLDKCNDAGDLVDPKGSFLTFISGAFSDTENFNKYIRKTSKLSDQIGDFTLAMKQKKAKVTIPDPEHFNKRFQYFSGLADSGRMNPIQAKTELAKEFLVALEISIDANLKSAKEFGINPPKETLKIKDR